jgi:thiosulfate dehydrogenase (quinone) large subunit
MEKNKKLSLFLLRFVLGWLFAYAGITKLFDPTWSAAGYIKSAQNFTPLYSWLASSEVLPVVNFLNIWGLTLAGVCLLLGVAVRFSSIVGIVIMFLYYFVLPFPNPNPHALIVDEHLIYIAALFVLACSEAGHYFGLNDWMHKQSIVKKTPLLRKLLK